MVSCLWLLGLLVLGVDCLYSLCRFGFAISRYDFAYYVVLIGWVGFGGWVIVVCCLLFLGWVGLVVCFGGCLMVTCLILY